jgi:hypothetical protein
VKTSIQKTIAVRTTNLAIIVFCLLIIVSCKKGSSYNGERFAENGTKLSQIAIKVIADLKTSERSWEYDSELVKILNDPTPENYVMKEPECSASQTELLNLNGAFISLEKVFTAYQLQLDSKISLSNANFSEKMLGACNALDSLGMSKELKAKNNSLKKGLSSAKYRLEGSVFQLTDMYCEVWDQMAKKYLSEQLILQKDYAKGVKSIALNLFNTEIIKTKIDEPYSNNAVLVNLYKLRLIKQNEDKSALLEARINKVSESFRLLIQIQGELIKRNQNKVKVQDMNNKLEVLLTN